MLKFLRQHWLLIISIVYLLSPIDIIPEILVGPLGLIDDLGLVVVLLLKAIYDYRRDLRTKRTQTVTTR